MTIEFNDEVDIAKLALEDDDIIVIRLQKGSESADLLARQLSRETDHLVIVLENGADIETVSRGTLEKLLAAKKL